jgi:ferric-dicitrate binding protein FerR (iron transport regulator)
MGKTGSFSIIVRRHQLSRSQRIRTLTAAALLIILCPPFASSAESAIGAITALRGSAVIKRPGAGDPFPASVGTAVLVGDVVETRSDSAVQLSLTDESFMNVAAGSAVRVNQYSFDQMSNRRTTIIRVLEGRVRFVVFRLRSGDSSFRVEADKALMTAGGLADFVVMCAQGQAVIAVLGSSLNVRNALPYVIGNVNVGVNQRTIVKEKSPPTVPEVISPMERKEYLKELKKI